MSLLQSALERDLPANSENGASLRGGRDQSRDEVAYAGAGGRQTDADASGHSPHRRSHEGGILLMAADD